LAALFESSLEPEPPSWRDLLLEPLLLLDSIGALRLVAPRPASRLFSSEGLRAQMNAWNEDTVNTPKRLSVFLVARDTCVSKLCKTRQNLNYNFSLAGSQRFAGGDHGIFSFWNTLFQYFNVHPHDKRTIIIKGVSFF